MELSDVRCYECGQRIPEGLIVRGDVSFRAGFDMEERRRESFCPECAVAIERQAAAERKSQAEDRYYTSVGSVILLIGLAAVLAAIGGIIYWLQN